MILRIVKETIGPSMPKNGRPNERMDEWMKRESNNTCSPIFFPPQICHGRRIRFINACCKNCCASLPPQGGGHGECASFSPTFGYFNWPRVSEQISQDAVSVWFTSFCERRAKRGRKKARASFLRWYPEVGIGLLNGGISERSRWPRDKNGATRGRGKLSRPCMGEGKNGGEGGEKKGRNSLFLLFFFPPRVTVGHVQNLNHPPRPAIRFISGEVSRGFRAAS